MFVSAKVTNFPYVYLNSIVRKYSSAQREVTDSEVFYNAVIFTTLHVAFLRISHTTGSSA